MLQRIAAYISGQHLLRAGDRLGVAVSGGADSVALLRILLELRDQLGIVLSVVHLHHGIRGTEADDDERFVRELAETNHLPAHIERVEAPSHAAQQGVSLETAARELRYAFFHRLLASSAVDKIATAHTLDDQAETILLRLVRGTGTRGLAGISVQRDSAPGSPGSIIRPLLAISRREIEIYLGSLQQPWRQDSSNRDFRHLRNRVRHTLLPLLEREYNPQIRVSLANLAEIARAEEELWLVQLNEIVDTTVTWEAKGARIRRESFVKYPLAVRRRVLLRVADVLAVPPGFDEIEEVVQSSQRPGSNVRLGSGWEVRAERDCLVFRQICDAPVSKEYEYVLDVPGEVTIPETGQCLRALMRDSGGGTGYNPATSLAFERLTLPLRVRNWQPGDRYWPLGNKQPEKLKRLFQQKRILSPARPRWPVVLSENSIVWVPGFPVAHEFAARRGGAVRMEVVPSDALT